MQEFRLVNDIHIHRPQQEIFHYVTQPWRWHEWHPASESASANRKDLRIGDGFEEVVSMRPFGLLPLRMRRHLRWTVVQSQAPQMWEVHGTSATIDVRVRYELDASQATQFRRTFHFTVKGWMRHIARSFVLPRMQRQSDIAMQNLKLTLESQEFCATSPLPLGAP